MTGLGNLAFVATLFLGQTATVIHSGQYCDLADAARMDGSCILKVTSVGSPRTLRLVLAGAGSPQSVIDVQGVSPERPNEAEHVLIPVGPTTKAIDLKRGHTYLFLGYRASSEQVAWPTYSSVAKESLDMFLSPVEPGLILAVDVFATDKHEMPSDADAPTRICKAVLEAADASDKAAHEVTEFFKLNLYPGHQRRTLGVIDPTPLSIAASELASRTSGYRRVKLLEIPLRWRVRGSAQPYVDALLAYASAGHTIFEQMDDEFEFSLALFDFEPPVGYVELTADSKQWVSAITGHGSERMRYFLLLRVPVALDDSQCKDVAVLLDDPEETIVRDVCNLFARHYGRPDLIVRGRYVDEGGKQVWKEETLPTAKAFWKRKFGG